MVQLNRLSNLSFEVDDLRRGSIADWSAAINGNIISRKNLVEMALENITSPDGEGARTFISFDKQATMTAADLDALAEAGVETGPLSGLPISIKDLIDQQGEVTASASLARSNVEPALEDAEAVKRLKAAGAVIVGRTNMTEFAYSGLGLNPHYGTPKNPYRRSIGLIPGGSSSGAAISVSDGMAVAAIGSDTGGSLRIPAALCGLVGFKPSQARMPMQGIFPLSETLDTIGPIARSVDCCASIDSILAGDKLSALKLFRPCDLRLGVLDRFVIDDLDPEVSQAYTSALSKISRAGVVLSDVVAEPLSDIASINRYGGFAAIESYANLGGLLLDTGEKLDPYVFSRISRGEGISAVAYREMIMARNLFKEKMAILSKDVDALICPTVPIVAPSISLLENDAELSQKTDRLLLRNPSIANLLDCPSISIPCQGGGSLPVGFMIIGKEGEDRSLLEAAATIEGIFSLGISAL